MNSFDIKSLFINIPLEETINICVDKLFQNKAKIDNLTREYFWSLLEVSTLDSFFIFHGKYYKLKDGAAVGSPLGPTLANVFYIILKNNGCLNVLLILNLFHIEGVLTIYILLFSSELQVAKFLNYINSKRRNITFTIERGENNLVSFLHVKVFMIVGNFTHQFIESLNFLANFASFLPISY